MRKPLIGVMCPGDNATQAAIDTAYELGKLIAKEGWILLSGGRKVGAMNAVNEGAKKANGLTVGVTISNTTDETSDFVDIAIVTGMGSARNVINVLSSDALIIIADGMGPGTVSEAALALKANKKIVVLHADEITEAFFGKLRKDQVSFTNSPQAAIAQVKTIL
jgi:uncharacterized protein (TIGR00725 family)